MHPYVASVVQQERTTRLRAEAHDARRAVRHGRRRPSGLLLRRIRTLIAALSTWVRDTKTEVAS